MHTQKFKVSNAHREVQKNLQKIVRVVYEDGQVQDPAIISQALMETFDCGNSNEVEICLGRGTSLTVEELQKHGIDIMLIKRVFCKIYPSHLRQLHIQGAVHAEIEQITGILPPRK